MTQRFSARVAVDGADLATSADSLRAGIPAIIDGLTIQWGRPSRLDQPDIGSMTVNLLVPPEAARATLARLTPGARIVAYTSFQDKYAGSLSQNIIHGYTTIPEGATLTVPPALLDAVSIGDQWSDISRWDPSDPLYRTSLRTTITHAPAVFAAQVRPVYYKTIRDPAPTYGPWSDLRAPLGKQWQIGPSASLNQTVALDPARAGSYVGWQIKVTSAKATLIRDATGTFRDASTTITQTNGITVRDAATFTSIPQRAELTIFAGRIASSPITWDDKAEMARINVTCNEWTIDTKNKKIGDTPWDVELLSVRLARICKLAGVTNGVGRGRYLDPITPYRDVDVRSALDLLHEYATAAGLVVWPSYTDVDGEVFLMEGQDDRITLLSLTYGADGQARIQVAGTGQWNPVRLPASAIRRSGVVVDRDVATLAASVRITGQTYTPEAMGWQDTKNIDDADTVISDPGRLSVHGAHEVHVTAPILTPNDAPVTQDIFRYFSNENTPEDLARAILARTAPGQWQITGLTVDGRAAAIDLARLVSLLRIYTRPGLPILLTDMPEWMPGAPAIPVYLDGGTYTLAGGYWTCALTVTHGASQHQSITLAETSPHLISDFQRLTFTDTATAHA